MKKIMLCALVAVAAPTVLADEIHAVSLEGVYYKAKSNGASETLNGFAVGYGHKGVFPIPFNLKAEFLQSNHVDLSSVVVSTEKQLWSNGIFHTNANIGVGISRIEYDNNISFSHAVLPVSLDTGVNVGKKTTLYGSLGYRYDFNVHKESKVKINGENVTVKGEDIHGLTFKLGAKYAF